MSTAQDALRIAAAEIGTTETPVNRQKYSTADGRPAESWCADFCEWVLRQAGVPGPVRNTYGNAGALVNGFGGNIHIAPLPGDLVGYHFPGEAAGIDHVGIVESVDYTHQTVTSIEGNTTSGDAGVQSNGGGVYRRTRPLSQVVGFGRPSYVTEAPMPDAPPNYALSGVPCALSAVVINGAVVGYYIMTDDGSIAAIGNVPYLGRVHKA